MPNARQYPFQVVEQRGALVAPSVSTTSQLADQLQQLLQNGVNAAGTALNVGTQQTEIDNRQLEAQGRLAAVAEELGKKEQIIRVESKTEANNLAIGVANEQMQEAKQNLAKLMEQRQQQGFAMINSASRETLVSMINDGTAHNMDPLGHLQLEQKAGERLATLDTVDALRIMAKNPNFTPDRIIATFMGQQPLSSDLAKASYMRTLSGDLLRFYEGAQLEQIRQTRQMDSENLIVRLQRDISFDVRDESLTPEKMMQRIGDFGTQFRSINRTASDIDVYRATAEALSGVVGSGELARFAPGRLVGLLDGVGNLAQKDPVFQNLWAKVAGDIRQQVIARESNKVGILSQLVESAQDQTGLEAATAAVLTAGTSGEIFPTSGPGLADRISKRKTELQGQFNADARVFQAPGSHLAPLPQTEAQDKAIDKSVGKYVLQNPKRLPDGSARPWSFVEEAQFTYERTGRLTSSQIERLNAAVSVPLDPTKATPDQMQGWTDATTTVQNLVDTAPQYVRQLVQEGRLDPKLSIAGVAGASLGKVQAAGYGATAVAQRLANVDEAKLLEAEALLKGETQFNFPGSKDRQYINAPKGDINAAIDLVANSDRAVKDAFGAGWFTMNPDYGSSTANDAFGAAFKYNYARLRQGGMDVLPAAQMAKSQAQADVTKTFQAYSLGFQRQKYVVGPDFPIIAEQTTPTNREQAMEQFNTLWVAAQMQAYNKLPDSGRRGIGWDSVYNSISLNFDNWKVEGTGVDAVLVVPIRNQGIDMLNLPEQGQAGVFRVPLDTAKRKALLTVPADPNAMKRSIGAAMDMPQWGIEWGEKR